MSLSRKFCLCFLIVSDTAADATLVTHFKCIATAWLLFLIYIYKLKIHRRGQAINHYCLFFLFIHLFYFFVRPTLSTRETIPVGFEPLRSCCLIQTVLQLLAITFFVCFYRRKLQSFFPLAQTVRGKKINWGSFFSFLFFNTLVIAFQSPFAAGNNSKCRFLLAPPLGPAKVIS